MSKIGVFPISNHYYDPQFIHDDKIYSHRNIQGIDYNLDEQLKTIKSFEYGDELKNFPLNKTKKLEFYYNNESYPAMDAEILYSMIRKFKPKNIIEIGSGNSTLMMLNAINQNKYEDINYICKITCIEPYEMQWLEKTSVNVIREKLEDIDTKIFNKLGENDILFIDSSHMIKPGGDVLKEYLEILPSLNKGVYIHVHDILTPYEYPKQWLSEGVNFWNEQYLLESFLIFNNKFEIFLMNKFIYENYKKSIDETNFPNTNIVKRPGCSIWLKKVN